MSFSPTNLNPKCQRCGLELPYGTLACANCHTLVYADQVEQLGREAKALEARGELMKAREQWLKTLPLLPPNAAQALWVHERARALEVAANTPKPPQPASKWKKWLGPLAPIAVLLAKFKSFFLLIFKFKFLLSFASYIALYWALYGWKFGVGFATLISLGLRPYLAATNLAPDLRCGSGWEAAGRSWCGVPWPGPTTTSPTARSRTAR